MEIYLFLFLVIAVFALLLAACLKGKNPLFRLLPLIALGVLEALCLCVYSLAQQPWTAFLSGLFSVILLVLLAVDGFAWGAYAGVYFYRRHQKNSFRGTL